MPKVQRDELLLKCLQAIVKECDGYGRAAKRLSVDKTTLWRFCTSGRAIERTRLLLSASAKRYEKDTNRFTLGRELSHLPKLETITTDDLQAIRHFCQKMISLVDAYEKMADDERLVSASSEALSVSPDATIPER